MEFPSVLDAVRCAVAIQMAGHQGIVPRIGINLGDVLVDGDDLYGDGVNVAARLEQLAEPGGLCVAGVVADSVANRVEAAFSDGGEVRVKNIDRPIRVHTWPPGGAATPAKPSQPAIAVLPSTTCPATPSRSISRTASARPSSPTSKASGLMDIARNSSFTDKGRNTDFRTVERELGVTAVLEGSIRKAGNRVRISAQPIDTANGADLWADRYDRELTDIFAVQDEVTHQIGAALKVRLTPAEAARIARLLFPEAAQADHLEQGNRAADLSD
ncbi:MAG: adenylate/guanylate cyclase domain-containing protein [Pseudooceanicola sp.]|nr:adenylate/guanylate cyclase domain-containing protein [Pseudooceanicola sp.]